MEDDRLDKYFYLKESDLVNTWLDYSKNQPPTMAKPTIDGNIVAFIYHSCDELQLKQEIAFMAVEMMAKYMETLQATNIPANNYILCILTIIIISNNLVGFRPNLAKSKIVNMLRAHGLFSYDVIDINKKEVEISLIFEFKFPLTTMLDDIHAIVGTFLKAPIVIEKIQEQCEYLLNMFYLSCKVITEMLDEYYGKKNMYGALKKCYETRLYFPAGVYLTALKIQTKTPMYDDCALMKEVADYVEIGVDDFYVFVSIFVNILCLNLVDE